MTRDCVLTLAAALPTVLWTCACGEAGTAPPPHDPVPTAVVVEPGAITLTAIGATAGLTARVNDQNGWAMTNPPLSWSSSDADVADVDATGVVTAAANGTATVTATSGAVSGTATVTVAQEASGALALAPDSESLGGTTGAARLLAPDSLLITELGAAAQLRPSGSDANGQALGPGANVTWASSRPAVAAVDASGLVTALANGRTDVTATSGPTSARLTVVVSDLTADADSRALVALYEATDGPNWVNNENWLTHAPLGEWYGVDTNANGRVVWLDLAGEWDDETGRDVPHGLSGPIPPELGNLTNLVWLELGYNRLTGAIPPELGNLANLERLELFGNRLTGSIPPELGNLAMLRLLHLNVNNLTGAIPSELGNLASLTWLLLRGNNLTGTIPPELGNLANLIWLTLNHNRNLTGAIPPELGNLANLELLNLDGNNLTGAIPSELGNLASLTSLTLAYNNLNGTIPSELGSLANLRGLLLNGNSLTGAIPSELGSLASLRRLGLSSNPDLSGHLPRSFLGLSALRWLFWGDTGVCAPADQVFQDWLKTLEEYQGRTCAAGSSSDAGVAAVERPRPPPLPGW